MNCAVTADEATTRDAFLGGRLMLRQPRRGHRAGHDAVLLAAATAGRAGERVVEFGAGIGTAALALAARVGGLDLVLWRSIRRWRASPATTLPPITSPPRWSNWTSPRPLLDSRRPCRRAVPMRC